MRSLPFQVTGDDELRHGYTMSHVNALSLTSVRRQPWHESIDFDHRVEIAWHAIVECIYSSEDRPEARDLIRAAFRALSVDAGRTSQFHGKQSRDHYAGTNNGFERYWWYAGQPVSSPEERVVERLAVVQIWPQLRPSHREVLEALAEHEDYGLAAAALGKSRKAFIKQLGEARIAFLRFWHEGETPSRPWGRDRRGGPDNPNLITTRTIRRRRFRAAARAAAPRSGA